MHVLGIVLGNNMARVCVAHSTKRQGVHSSMHTTRNEHIWHHARDCGANREDTRRTAAFYRKQRFQDKSSRSHRLAANAHRIER